jgi:RND superfamily putative drug exporter
MALGVVLDAIVVRSLLVPALVALFGRPGMWPGNRRARPEPAPAKPPPVPAGDQP